MTRNKQREKLTKHLYDAVYSCPGVGQMKLGDIFKCLNDVMLILAIAMSTSKFTNPRRASTSKFSNGH